MARLLFILLLAICAGACSSEADHGRLSIEYLDPPVDGGAGQVSVATLPGGGHLLSWIERGEDFAYLKVAKFANGEWTDPSTAASGSNWFINWADFPGVLAVDDSTWYTFVLPRTGDGTFAYHVHAVVTSDAGQTWSIPEPLHEDTSATEHGFVSMAPWNRHAMAVWLDGRGGAASATSDGHSHAPMTLRAGYVAPDGSTADEFEIDDRVCDCCQTAAVGLGSSMLVAYRNRDINETRDIHLARFDGRDWSLLGAIHDDGWVIAGCPVNGPALAADGHNVAAAWFTAAGGQPRVYVALSNDGGVTFGSPRRIDGGLPLGRVDVAVHGRNVLVSWLEETASDAELRLALLSSADAPGVHTVSAMSRSRGSGFPRMASSGSETLIAWLDYDEASRETKIELAMLRVD